jgi:hypothetical protein
MQKDWLATVVDGFYRENECYVDGDITRSSYTLPLSYKSHFNLLPVDDEIQFLLTTHILPKELFLCSSSSSSSSTKKSIISPPLELYTLRTCGDGDCLLHAISLGLWGREDTTRYLRGLLSLALSSETLRRELLQYWCEEEFYRDISLGFIAARDFNEIKKEFEITIERAHEPGKYLEGIHIASLANILRRPILCYSQDTITGMSTNDMTAQSLSGIYLPILHDPKECCRVPLVIVYTMLGGVGVERDGEEDKNYQVQSSYHVGHFSAIVGVDTSQHTTRYTSPSVVTRIQNNSSAEWESQREESTVGEAGGIYFPLIGNNYHLLPLRYCYAYQLDSTAGAEIGAGSGSSRKNKEKRNELLYAYFDIEHLTVSSLDDPSIRRGIPVATTKRSSSSSSSSAMSSRGRGTSKSLSSHHSMTPQCVGSVVYQSKKLFYSNVLNSKQNELESLKEKMREIEVWTLTLPSLSSGSTYFL